MADINLLVVSGRLTRDSELTYTEGGMAILRFSLANNRRIKKNNEWVDYPQYFDCVVFSKRAESLSAFLKKGKPLVLNGSLRYDSWQDKNTGDKRSKISILVDNIQMLGSSGSQVKNNSSVIDQDKKNDYSLKDDIDIDENFDEDIPF